MIFRLRVNLLRIECGGMPLLPLKRLIFVLGMLVGWQLAGQELTDETAARIISLHLQARGGEEAIKGIETLESTGRLREGSENHQIYYLHSPDGRARLERKRTALGWDYETVQWVSADRVVQQEFLPKPQPPTIIEAEVEARLAQLEGMLPFLFVDYPARRHAFSYRGQGTFAGRPVLLVQGQLANGFRLDIYFDSNTFLVLNYRYEISIAGKRTMIDRMPTGARRVGGVLWESGHDFRVGQNSFSRLEIAYQRVNVVSAKAKLTAPEVRELWLRVNP